MHLDINTKSNINIVLLLCRRAGLRCSLSSIKIENETPNQTILLPEIEIDLDTPPDSLPSSEFDMGTQPSPLVAPLSRSQNYGA